MRFHSVKNGCVYPIIVLISCVCVTTSSLHLEYSNATKRNENTRIKGIYDNAKNAMSEANTENEYKIAALKLL